MREQLPIIPHKNLADHSEIQENSHIFKAVKRCSLGHYSLCLSEFSEFEDCNQVPIQTLLLWATYTQPLRPPAENSVLKPFNNF